MDENEFKRLLHLFPVVRSRDYQAELASSSESTSQSGQNELRQWQDESNNDGKTVGSQDAFWDKLRSTAEKKDMRLLSWLKLSDSLGPKYGPLNSIEVFALVGAADAEKFCAAFKKVYEKLVHEGLSEEEARRFINSR